MLVYVCSSSFALHRFSRESQPQHDCDSLWHCIESANCSMVKNTTCVCARMLLRLCVQVIYPRLDAMFVELTRHPESMLAIAHLLQTPPGAQEKLATPQVPDVCLLLVPNIPAPMLAFVLLATEGVVSVNVCVCVCVFVCACLQARVFVYHMLDHMLNSRMGSLEQLGSREGSMALKLIKVRIVILPLNTLCG